MDIEGRFSDMTVWFTSDPHFGHANVINHCRRPFPHVDEMNSQLIKRWNRWVQPNDQVYILGDFALCRAEQAAAFAHGLNGTKFLVAGNHDRETRKKKVFTDAFEWVKDYAEIKVPIPGLVAPQRIIMCHFPFLTWNSSHHASWNLHGHCHGNLKDDPHSLRIDVGVDCWDFTPVSFDTIRASMARKLWKPVDHHGVD